ncbi:GntR family transcriptional regulator, glv operon transcriptional regulator [Vibrio gazogenes DSM 21264]|uniref:GntR family transcriptional regulator, glv operon transcriptional regulator n=1 Tax=Vibrio gazogenes DSM 21264 = NBRC 103151 TaxID=1123492 RepID=A0A1M5FU59_VIBGA|nr:GntR family transcriptional regulator [Vibrio gazogenes]SHF95006.1 GntR family transcriptional regulator, glv operon transcriptional regulator [Vibrio gazogenes DSM 21264] [Vibrio gazogenes DSM 21264 = NBRC 103151]SJN54878.1 putative HTH-type transcriptional regulator YidP [Vibrio gazogenes]
MIYILIANDLRKRINSDEFCLNQPLPREVMLAEEYQVSRMTLRRAIDCLVEDGLIERRHGSGNFVIDKEIAHENKGLNSLTELSQKNNKSIASQVLSFSMTPAPVSVAQRLKIQHGELVYYIIRVRYLDERPVHYEESYLPVKLYPTLSVAHLEKSKFDYIEKEAGFIIEGNYFTFLPILTPASIAAYLKVEEGTPTMQVTSISNAPDGTILDFSITTENIHHYQSTYYFRRTR